MPPIPRGPVTDAILTHLATQCAAPVGDHTAPHPAPSIYHVLEGVDGSRLDGALGDPAMLWRLRIRVRTVAVSSHVATSRQACEHHADQATAAILDRTPPIDGDGWQAGHRALVGDSGPLTEGPAVNIVRDYEMLVTSGPEQPPAS